MADQLIEKIMGARENADQELFIIDAPFEAGQPCIRYTWSIPETEIERPITAIGDWEVVITTSMTDEEAEAELFSLLRDDQISYFLELGDETV